MARSSPRRPPALCPALLLIGRDSSEAYVCDNHQVAELLFGSAGQSSQQAGAVELTGADGARVGATFGAPVINGTATLPGQPPARFTAEGAHGDAGLYEASTVTKGALLQGRWIVEPNHEVAGAAKLNGTIVANPSLQHNVNLTAGTLQPVAVGTVGRTIRQLIPHLSGISTPAQWPNPTPKPSVPDTGAPLFLDGTGLVGNVQVTLIGPYPTGPIRGTAINGSAVFFDTPQLPVEGTYQVSVTTAGGTSNSLPLRVVHVR